MHVFFPFPLPSCLFLDQTATRPVALVDLGAVRTQVVGLAVGAVAWWVLLLAVLADVHGAGGAFAENAGAALSLIAYRAVLRAEEGLAALPFGWLHWGFAVD